MISMLMEISKKWDTERIYAEYDSGNTKNDESGRGGALALLRSEVAGAGRLLPACICPSELWNRAFGAGGYSRWRCS
jgi:hypothetical protein